MVAEEKCNYGLWQSAEDKRSMNEVKQSVRRGEAASKGEREMAVEEKLSAEARSSKRQERSCW